MTRASSTQLETMPSLAALYRRALLTRRHGLKANQSLPEIEVSLTGVPPKPHHLKRYIQVCQFHAGDHLPLTYPHVLAFPLQLQVLTDKRFPVALLGLIHTRNNIEQYRPIGKTEILDIRCRLGETRETDKGHEFDLHTYIDAAGERVWASTSTFLKKAAQPKRDAQGRASAQAMTLEPRQVVRWPVPEDTGRRYAWVAGDMNLIHIHPLTAKLFGFSRAIAHGMWSKARCVAELERHIPAGAVSVSVEFKVPVSLPARVQMIYQPEHGRIPFELLDENAQVPHLRGQVTFLDA